MTRDTPIPSSYDRGHYKPESGVQRLFRRIKEEPLIPLGMALTVGALIGAGRAMRRQDHKRANIMFRRRLYAQGFTILIMLVGSMYWKQDREKRKEFETLEKERRDAVKRDRWLAELEARDTEDKVAKDRVDRLKDRRKQREDAMRAKILAEGEDLSEDGNTGSIIPAAASISDTTTETSKPSLIEQASRLWSSKKE